MISIIFPTYNEQDNLIELHSQLDAVVSEIKGDNFEFLFVDDCSTDHTPNMLRELHDKDRRVKVIRFSRNCGSHAAIAAGLRHCQGNCAIVLAADLQDPPVLIFRLVEAWKKGAQLVWAARGKREGVTLSTNIFSQLYYWTMNHLTSVKMPPLGVDVFLADRVVIEALQQIQEKHSSIFMSLAWLGFRQSTIEYVKEARYAGKSKWTLRKKIKLALDSLLAFSDIPIRVVSLLGVLVGFLGIVYAIVVFCNFINGNPSHGWAFLMVAVLVIGGVQMMMLGILGEYMWRTFDQSRLRPRYIIEYKID